jgi:hypothetical protein
MSQYLNFSPIKLKIWIGGFPNDGRCDQSPMKDKLFQTQKNTHNFSQFE